MEILSFVFLCAVGALMYWFFFKCVDWFEKDLKRRNNMFTALFILSVVMFGYMMYVLIKPEEF